LISVEEGADGTLLRGKFSEKTFTRRLHRITVPYPLCRSSANQVKQLLKSALRSNDTIQPAGYFVGSQ
jgi:hypothetical protein